MKFSDFKDFALQLFGPNGPEIRPMIRQDLDEVLRIIRLHDSDDYRAAKRSFAHVDWDADSVAGQHFVLIDDAEDRIVGVCGYYIDDLEAQGIYWLGWTYVNPFFRGKGHGGRLLHFVMRTVKRFGARKLYLSTSDLPEFEAAVAFYKKYGFQEEGRFLDYYCDGESKIVMAVTV